MEIENNIPIPTGAGQRGRQPYLGKSIKAWLEELEPGQSILFDTSIVAGQSVRSISSRLTKETGKRFTARAVEEDQMRVWRLE